MAITSYDELKSTVAQYLGRSDLTTMIPTFIDFAEARLSRELRTMKMLKNVTSSMTSGTAKLALPSDYISIRDIFIQGNPRTSLVYMSPSAFSREARADQSGKPINYTIYGSEFVFGPVPDSAYTLELLYYARPSRLDEDTSSNAFLANYPDALLYASLLEAEPYLMNDGRVNTWGTMYDRAINTINKSDDDGEYSAVPLTIKTV